MVPVDDSVASFAAQQLAVLIANNFKSTVTVLSVVSHPLMNPSVQSMAAEIGAQEFAPGQIVRGEYSMPRQVAPPDLEGALSSKMLAEISDWYHQRGNETADEAVRLFKQEGIPAERKVVEHADKADSILREAEDGKYSLIVIGRTGEEEKETQLSGTTEKVVRHSKIPVLVGGERKKLAKVLVPVDGSKGSDKALKLAVTLAKKLEAKITLLHVQEGGFFTLKPEVAKRVGKHILAQAARKTKGIETNEKLESGDVGRKIAQIAEKEDYDIIVMGSKGHGSIKRFLLGSASSHVLHYTNHPVLIVK